MGVKSFSIDMIRLKTKIFVDYFQAFHDAYSLEPRFTVFYSSNVKDYRYGYSIAFDNTSVWIGYLHNSEKVNQLSHYLVCEFNPNKIDFRDPIFRDIILRFFSGNYQIVSFDFAVDLDVDINNVYYVRGGRHVKIFDYGGSNKTIYIGERGNRVKIYNKAIEQGLKGRNWTRIEYSFKCNISNSFMVLSDFSLSSFPDIYVVEQLPAIDDLTLKALFYAVMSGYPIDDLSRVYRAKIKKIMSSLYKLEIRGEDIIQNLKDVVNALNSIIAYI